VNIKVKLRSLIIYFATRQNEGSHPMSENISAKLSAQANEIRSTSSLRPDAQEIPTPQHLAKILSVENTQ
jgi:hypothetical protein